MASLSDGWMSGMILTGENRRAGRKTCCSATLPTTNLTWTSVGLNPVLRGVGQGTVLAGDVAGIV